MRHHVHFFEISGQKDRTGIERTLYALEIDSKGSPRDSEKEMHSHPLINDEQTSRDEHKENHTHTLPDGTETGPAVEINMGSSKDGTLIEGDGKNDFFGDDD